MVSALASPGASDWRKMKVQELREELASRGLEITGLKAALIERLEASVPNVVEEGEAMEEGEAKKDIDLDMNEEIGSMDDINEKQVNEKPVEVKSAVDAGTGGGAPVAVHVDPVGVSAEPDDRVAEAGAAPAAPPAQEGNGTAAAPSTDLERKQRRAERFGLDLMVSEDEKRRLRAARFASSSPANGTDKNSPPKEVSKVSPTVKENEAVKRKARAARFGIEEVTGKQTAAVTPALTALGSNDDAKKKARLARFGLKIKLDPQEQEKKKLRAARFGLPTESSNPDATKKVPVEQPAVTN